MLKTKKQINSQESQDEDFAAVKRILDGDKSAYAILQNKYQRIIASLIRRMVKDEDDVDDLTQETFIKAYNALTSFQFGYSFSAWIYKIASNNCIDFLRKKRFQTVSLSQPIAGGEEDQFLEIEDNSYVPGQDVMDFEKSSALLAAIEKLPENYREIIKLRHQEELDYKQISDKLNLPLGTVKAHLFRARQILLLSLKKQRHLFVEN